MQNKKKNSSAKCEKVGKQKGGLLVVVLRRGAGRRGDAVRWFAAAPLYVLRL